MRGFNTIMDWIISFIKNLNVNLAYLTTVTALSGTIVAIAIPLSIDIIARISARFESSIIAKKFNSEKSIGFLKFISFLLLFSSSAILFLFDENLNSFNWNLIIFIHFIISIISIFSLVIFFKKIVLYIKDNRYILNKLFDNANTAIKSDKNYSKQKNKFIESIEGIGDVLVHDTQYKQNKLIKDNLKKFRELIIYYTNLAQDNPNKFEKITFEDKYLEHYYSQDDDSKDYLNYVSSHRNMITFQAVINQFIRIHNISLEKKNQEISSFIISNLNYIVYKLSIKKNTLLLIKNVLIEYNNMLRENISKEIEYQSAYLLATEWYTNSIYSIRSEENYFNFDFLELFNKYLRSNLILIIKNEKSKLFKAFISKLDFISLGFYSKTTFNYSDKLLFDNREIYDDKKIRMKTIKLDEKLDYIYNNESFNEWIEEFDQLKKIIENNISQKYLKELLEEEKEVKNSVVSRLKHNNLLKITCYIGAYCIFRKKYSYIKYMWNYHQPEDASYINTGHNLIPNSFNKVLDLILKGNLFYNSDLWDGNHSSQHYYETYIILLLMKILDEKKEIKISLTKYNARELNDLKYRIDNLKNKTIKENEMIKGVGFDLDKARNLANNKLSTKLDIIVGRCENNIEKILIKSEKSSKKICEFKEKFTESFYKNSIVRNWLEQINVIKFEYGECDEEYFEFNPILVDRSTFIDDWHVDSTAVPANWANRFSQIENKHLINKILSLEIETKHINESKYFNQIEKSIKNLIDKSFKDIILISIGGNNIHRLFRNNESFINIAHDKSKALLTGYYKIEGYKIPIL